MKYLIPGIVLSSLLFQACNKDDVQIDTCENCSFTCLDINETDIITSDCVDNWECNFLVTPESEIDLDEYGGLTNGARNVFQMINSTLGELNIADDEFTNILVFELDETQDSFSVEGGELADIKMHFRRICFCTEGVEFRPVTAGCIQGEKQSDAAWIIQANLSISYSFADFDIKFDAEFSN